MTRAPTAVMRRAMLLNNGRSNAPSRGSRRQELSSCVLVFGRNSAGIAPTNRGSRPSLRKIVRESHERLPSALPFRGKPVVVAIDLVTQARDRLELVIQLEDLVQITNAGRVNFEFEHLRET